MAEFYRKKKKICQMCAGKSVDYKDVMIVSKYVNEKDINIIINIIPNKCQGLTKRKEKH